MSEAQAQAIEAQPETLELTATERKALDKMKEVWNARESRRGRAPAAISVLSGAFPKAGEAFETWKADQAQREEQEKLLKKAMDLLK